MEIYDKHTKEIHSLLQEIKNPNSNKLQLNELLFVNLSSLCKYVSDKIIFGKQEENIIIKKEERIKENFERMDRFNDMSLVESSLEISKIENIKRVKIKDMNMTFNTEKTAENFDDKKRKQTLEFEDEGKMNTSKYNEMNFDYFSEKEDISTIYNVKLDNSFQTNFLDPFDKEEKFNRNTLNLSHNYSLSDIKKKEESKEISNMRNSYNFENKELKSIKDLVNNELSDKDILKISKEMSAEYIIDLYKTYQKMRKYASKNFEVENIMFVNRFKQFLLEIGISEKRLYEQCIRLIIYKKNIFTFNDFHLCFHKILNLKYEFNFLKYKLLYHLTNRKNEKIIEVDELERFMILLKSARIYDPDVYNRINIKLKDKYKEIFPKLNTLHFRKLSLVLELFFNIR